MLFQNYRQDLRRSLDKLVDARRTPTLRDRVVATTSAGMQAVTAYRFGSWVRSLPTPLRLLLAPLRLLLTLWVRIAWGIEIDRGACIGPGLYVGHFGCITVGAQVVAGRNLTLSQGVTVGVAGREGRRGSPVLGDDVYLGAGAKVFGPIQVGHNVKVGANAVIHQDVPDHAVVALAPGCRIVSMQGNRPVASAANHRVYASNVRAMPRRHLSSRRQHE